MIKFPGNPIPQLASGPATSNVFRLQAKIDENGVASTASLSVQINGVIWFQSGLLTTPGDPNLTQNSNFSLFGSGATRTFTFLFKQDSFGQTGLIPAAGTSLGIKINGNNSPGGNIGDVPTYLSDFSSNGSSGTANAAPVPLPGVIPSFAMLMGIAVFGMTLYRRAYPSLIA